MQSKDGAKAQVLLWFYKWQPEAIYQRALYPSVKKYSKATMHKVALTIKEGRKSSLFFPWLILGPLALLLLPTAANGVCACGWTLQREKHLLSREDSALLSKHLEEWHQTFLKEHELNLRLSIQLNWAKSHVLGEVCLDEWWELLVPGA